MPLDKRSELSPEALGGKAHGVVSAGLGGDAVLLGLEPLHGCHHRCRCLLVKKQTGGRGVVKTLDGEVARMKRQRNARFWGAMQPCCG